MEQGHHGCTCPWTRGIWIFAIEYELPRQSGYSASRAGGYFNCGGTWGEAYTGDGV